MSSDDSLETRWPLWPEGEPGQVLLDVTLGLPVDEAFLLLYGGLNDTKVRGRVQGQIRGTPRDWLVPAAATASAPAPATRRATPVRSPRRKP